MIRKSNAALVAGLILTLALPTVPALAGTTAAAAPTTSSTTSTVTETAAVSDLERALAMLDSSTLTADQKQSLRAALESLPAYWAERRESVAADLGASSHEWRAMGQSAINPDDYQCSATPVQLWLDDQLNFDENAQGALFLLQILGATDLPTYDALLFGKEVKGNTFGYEGEDTNALNRTMTNLRRLWDIDGSSIQLIPMHGDMLTDRARVERLYTILYGYTAEDAAILSYYVDLLVRGIPELRGGDHPIFTFNAFAFDPQDDADLIALGVTKRIVVGDGVLAGLDGAGLDEDAAAQAVLSHEYGHQVQFAQNLFVSDLPAPEATRRTELMADAYGTYGLVHARGAALNAPRTLQASEAFYNVGDCSFDSSSHHGTPLQRLHAAEWAVSVVNDAPDEGHKLASLTFADLFDAQLPELVAPDAR